MQNLGKLRKRLFDRIYAVLDGIIRIIKTQSHGVDLSSHDCHDCHDTDDPLGSHVVEAYCPAAGGAEEVQRMVLLFFPQKLDEMASY